KERRELLHDKIRDVPFVALCDGVVGEGKAFFQAAIAAGHEGIVGKKLTSRYIPNRRGTAWQKIKQTIELPCAVIGYHAGPDGVRNLVMATSVSQVRSVYIRARTVPSAAVDFPWNIMVSGRAAGLPRRVTMPCRHLGLDSSVVGNVHD